MEFEHLQVPMGIGHGGPSASGSRSCAGRAPVPGLWLIGFLAVAAVAQAEPVDVRLRVAWGGGQARQWQGEIRLVGGEWSDPRLLGAHADAAASIRIEPQVLTIRQARPSDYDGLQVRLTGDRSAVVHVHLVPLDAPSQERRFEIPVAALLTAHRVEPLDEQDNRIVLRRAPGDAIRIFTDRDALVFSPSERWRFDIVPHEIEPQPSPVHCRVRLISSSDSKAVWTGQQSLTLDAQGKPQPWTGLELEMPSQEGVYDLVIAIYRRRLPPSKPIAERTIQLVVASGSPPAPRTPAEQSVLELDPASPSWWERLPRWPTLPLTRWLPGGRTGPTSRSSTSRSLGGRSWVELPLGASQAYPLPIDHPGRPHEISIELPAGHAQKLHVSVVEPKSGSDGGYRGIHAGIVIPEEDVVGEAGEGASDAIRRYRVLVWPRSREPILWLANASSERPAYYGTVRVRSWSGGLPIRESPPGDRQVMAYIDGPSLTSDFFGPVGIDPASERGYDDWTTFYASCSNLVEYLGHVGYDGVALLAAGDGGTLYPSHVWNPTPRLDRGVFFESGQDPVRKDVLELLFRLCDRHQRRLIPLVRFNFPLPRLETLASAPDAAAEGVLLVDEQGRPWSQIRSPSEATGPFYNPLDPRVQDEMVRVVEELVSRYQHHASFGGLLIDLSANGYGQLPDALWGMDPKTLERFRGETGLGEEAGTGPLDPTQRQLMSQWLRWRAEQLARLYSRMRDVVVHDRQDARLYLGLANLVDAEPLRRALQPSLRPRAGIDQALLETGLDLQYLAKLDHVVVLRPRRYAPGASPAENGRNLELNHDPDQKFDTLLRATIPAGSVAGDVLIHEVSTRTLDGLDGPHGSAATGPSVQGIMSLATAAARGRFADGLAARDLQVIFDGGWGLPRGQSAEAQAWIDAFRSLPAGPFVPVSGPNIQSAPVAIRLQNSPYRTYVYLQNEAPWEVTARLNWKLPFGSQIRSLHNRPIPPLKHTEQGATWELDLEPYELVAVVIESAGVEIVQANATIPSHVRTRLEHRFDAFANRVLSLKSLHNRQPFAGLINPSFEQTDLAPRGENPQPAIPGWIVSPHGDVSATIEPSARVPNGRMALRIASDSEAAWVISEPIAPPTTGQLYVSVYLRCRDPAQQPPLIVGVEGELNGQTFHRGARLGTSPQNQLGEQWREFLFPILDLPVRGLDSLQVTFDLVAPGEVWIDHVQLYDIYLHPSEEAQLRSRFLGLASYHLQQGRLNECARLLKGYWPSLLIDHVQPYQQLADRTAGGEEPVAEEASVADGAAKEKEGGSGWMRRVRRMFPQWPRF